MSFVIDASIALAYVFQDERSPFVARAMESLLNEQAFAPAIWPLEVVNGLLVAERRKRITSQQCDALRLEFGMLPVEIDVTGNPGQLGMELEAARRLEISLHDASYLALAARRSIPLVTIDARLQRAAKKYGVEIIAE